MNFPAKLAVLCATLASAVLPNSGVAADIASDINVSRPYNLPRFMLGATLGSASHSDPSDSVAAYSVFGGLTVVQALAVEFGWLSFGEVGEKPDTVKSTAATLALKGSKKLSTQFSLFGKLGMAFWDYDVSGFGSDSGADVTWGAGMEWRITAGLHARMAMDFYTLSPTIKGESHTDDVDVFSFGLMYGF